ncbi:DNA polymerase IV [Paenibacillus athensensis]|uniref:DNA polymerase IV n=1 Tax=Paenibacillus athensensis TaxID=1967502 RepID=A0A4Y8PRC5_9BACL|nr:DNA polymerase IV [Paenibacillus athensensis]MCD1261678.1 DNA polymerase IV [Paenibacillus athensensis]
MTSSKQERVVFLSDAQSFYASVEKADHPGLANKPVVVAGDPERRAGIILAACPIAKRYGVTTAERLGESLKKCPDLVIMRPRMQHYIEVSLQITSIYKEFSDLVEVFSIDEQFIDVTASRRLFGEPPAIAAEIQRRVLQQTGVWVRIGIGPNKIMAKIATDIWAKKRSDGVFTLRRAEIAELLWPQPVSQMFGVGGRMTAHFARMGMLTIGDVARTPLAALKAKFRARFGKQSDIHAEVMWRTANGLDDSPVDPRTYERGQQQIGHMFTLPRDYREGEVDIVIRELCEEVCRDARRKGKMGQVVSVACMCSPYDHPTGFSRQRKMPDPTNHTDDVYEAARTLFYCHWDRMPVRRVGIALSALSDDSVYQLSLFEDKPRQRALDQVTDQIKERFGAAALVRASSLTAAGQAARRAQLIGGHYK